MNIDKLEVYLGISRQTIYYYQRKGLLKHSPDNENFSDKDIQMLLIIKLLRDMDIPIDDIKAILDNKISFNDCLKIRKLSLDNSIDELHEIKRDIEILKDMHVPLIPALSKIDLVKPRRGLGYRKTTKTVAYNRPLTRGMAIRQIISASLIAFIFTIFIYIIFFGENKTFNYFIFFSILATFIIVFTFIDFRWTMNIYDKSQNQSIEFLETGIRFYKRKGYINHFMYIMSALLNKHQRYQSFYDYKDISKLIIEPKSRYTPLYVPGINTGIALAGNFYEADLTFYFNDGKKIFLLGPSTFNNDSQFIGYILQEKVKNIIDNDNILYAYQNKINLTDYMISKKMLK